MHTLPDILMQLKFRTTVHIHKESCSPVTNEGSLYYTPFTLASMLTQIQSRNQTLLSSSSPPGLFGSLVAVSVFPLGSL